MRRRHQRQANPEIVQIGPVLNTRTVTRFAIEALDTVDGKTKQVTTEQLFLQHGVEPSRHRDYMERQLAFWFGRGHFRFKNARIVEVQVTEEVKPRAKAA